MTRLLGTYRRPAGGAGHHNNGGNNGSNDIINNNHGGGGSHHRSGGGRRGNGGHRRNPSNAGSHHNGNPSLCSRQSFMILAIGILMGYVIVPLFVLEVRFEDLFALDSSSVASVAWKEKKNDLMATFQSSSHSKYSPDTHSQSEERKQEQLIESMMRGSRSELNSPSRMNVVGHDTTHHVHSRSRGLETDDNNESNSETGGISNTQELVQHLLQSIQHKEDQEENDAGHLHIIGEYSDTEKRIMEDRDVLSHQSVPTVTTPYIMKTKQLPDHHRKKILVTGGAGFVGSHLVDKLMMEGHEVIVMDNFFTGQKKNIAHWLHHPNFSLVVHDVIEPIKLEVDQIYHLACPASPPHYQYNPVKTIKTSTMGTLNMLGLAKRVKARMLLTSTSEIYGDPLEHPQKESYWGNVNTIGPRSCYDEGKRVAETMMYSYRNQNEVEVRVARIFNTFGPRMHPNDGRVVSNFIIQSLQQKDITIYGDGTQTRSFQYVYDLVEGLYKLMNGDYDRPVNLGNPDEYSVTKFAEYIQDMTKSTSKITYLEKSQDDPSQRRPDISTAKEQIDWAPSISVEQGLKLTIDYFQKVLNEAGEIIPTGPGAARPEA